MTDKNWQVQSINGYQVHQSSHITNFTGTIFPLKEAFIYALQNQLLTMVKSSALDDQTISYFKS